MRYMDYTKYFVFFSIFLTACGGGGDTAEQNQSTTTNPINTPQITTLESIVNANIIASGYSSDHFFQSESGVVYYGDNCQRLSGDNLYKVFDNGFAYNFNVTGRGVELPSFCQIDAVLEPEPASDGSITAFFTSRFRLNPGFSNKAGYFDYNSKTLYILDDVPSPHYYKLTEIINFGNNAILTNEQGQTFQKSLISTLKLLDPPYTDISLYEAVELYQGDPDDIFEIGHSGNYSLASKPYDIIGSNDYYLTSGCYEAKYSDYVIYNDGVVSTAYDDYAFGVNEVISDTCVLLATFEKLPHAEKQNVNASMINIDTFIDSDGTYYDVKEFRLDGTGTPTEDHFLMSLIDGGHVGIIANPNNDITSRVIVLSTYRKL